MAPNGSLPTTVEVIEVSPRDGLQNEKVMMSTADKIELVERSIAAGFKRIEVTSFAHPRAVPQMADAEAVLAGLPERPDVVYSTLVLNEKGMDRAEAAGVDEVNFVLTTTDTFGHKNQGASVDQLMAMWHNVAARAHAAKIPASVSISLSFGCPYEGEVPVDRLVEVAARAMEAEPQELCIADSIGCATPGDIFERIAAVRTVSLDVPLRIHLHNTRNTGLANAIAAIQMGVDRLDSSIGGIGGCPFAPAATGNIPTEDLVWMVERMGVSTGIALDPIVLDTAVWLGEKLEKEVPGYLSRARPFPECAMDLSAA